MPFTNVPRNDERNPKTMNVTHGDIASACASIASSLCPFAIALKETGSDLLSTTDYDELFARIVPMLHRGEPIQDLPPRATAALSCRLFVISSSEIVMQREFPEASVEVDDLGVYVAALATHGWRLHATMFLFDVMGISRFAKW